MYPQVIMFDASYPPPVVGGKEKQAHLLASALIRVGLRVCALTFRGRGRTEAQLEVDGVQIHRVCGDRWRLIRAIRWLAKRSAGNTILHIHTPSRIGIFLGLCAKALGCRVVFKLPNIGLLHGRGNALRRFAVRHFDRVVALEEESERQLLAMGIAREAVLRMDNGVLMSDSVRPSARTDTPACVVFVARLVPQKRAQDLFVACRNLPSSVAWRMQVVGEGPLAAELQQQVHDFGLVDRVTFLGHRADATDIIARADLLVMTSEREGMPNVILEAMSHGTPVVASNVGAVSYVLGDVGKPYIYPVGDCDRLAQLMCRLLGDRDLREQYGRALRARCAELFDMRAIAQKYAEEYRKLL